MALSGELMGLWDPSAGECDRKSEKNLRFLVVFVGDPGLGCIFLRYRVARVFWICVSVYLCVAIVFCACLVWLWCWLLLDDQLTMMRSETRGDERNCVLRMGLQRESC